MGICKCGKQSKKDINEVIIVQNQNKVEDRNDINIQMAKKRDSLSNDTLLVMKNYLDGDKGDSVQQVQSQLEQDQVSQQSERVKHRSERSLKIQNYAKQNEIQTISMVPLISLCPQQCQCDRKQAYYWNHDVCDAKLYLGSNGDVVCVKCKYSEFIQLHEFKCPQSGCQKQFCNLLEFMNCCFQFIKTMNQTDDRQFQLRLSNSLKKNWISN